MARHWRENFGKTDRWKGPVSIYPVQSGDRQREGLKKWKHGKKQTDTVGKAWLQGNPQMVDMNKGEEFDN